MNMEKWAEREVALACKHEAPDRKEDEWDYGCACYESALKAYKSLLEDGHSGFSWSMTAQILNRLMNNRPLTPITDEDFFITDEDGCMTNESEEYLRERDLKSSIQCQRYSALFRSEHNDGTVTYSDVDRYYCYDIDTPDMTYQGGGACNILDELFPITMPYYPSKDRYVIAEETFLVDTDMGDFDTKGYLFITTPEGEKVVVDRYYKEIKDGDPITRTIECEQLVPVGEPDEEGNVQFEPTTTSYERTYQPTRWVEIDKEEYLERKAHRITNDNDN